MATYQDILDGLRVALHAPTTEVTDPQALTLCEVAIRKLNGMGVLLDQDDATITLLEDTYRYNVPADYTWIRKLEYEDMTLADEFWEEVPGFHWGLILTSGTPQFEFQKGAFDLRTSSPGNDVRITGQAKAAVPTDLAGTVPDELVGVFQDALSTLILGRLSMGQSELSRDRGFQRREEKTALVELSMALPDFRVFPNSRRVPGR